MPVAFGEEFGEMRSSPGVLKCGRLIEGLQKFLHGTWRKGELLN